MKTANTTLNDIFNTLSLKAGMEPVLIASLAAELNLSLNELIPQFAVLRKLNLIYFNADFIALTNEGMEILITDKAEQTYLHAHAIK